MATMPLLPAIFLQDACYKHKYIRSRDVTNIVERPERLRAVKLGVAVALARLEGEEDVALNGTPKTFLDTGTDELATVMERLRLEGTGTAADSTSTSSTFAGVPVIHSAASMPLLGSPAVKFIHGDIEGDVYLEKLHKWVKDSAERVGRGESEIPEGLPQGDLYLCPESINAIEGALGTVCEAVDAVVGGHLPSATSSPGSNDTNTSRAFVVVRPPGHHCGEDTPCGFCFVNNIAIGAAHAHLKHGINRVVIFDIDLHHGNGTQSIVWGINEETYRQTLEAESDAPPTKPGMKAYYGSIHDILSFPCEDGKPDLIQAASVSIHGPHGQWIENIHLEPYEDETSFHELYERNYSRLIRKAEQFLDDTGGPGEDVLVFVSCGMDACEHEYTSMSRHGRKVPVSFYHRFTQDACRFVDKYANRRLVSVLEGGYSDRALLSGTLAHLCGMVEVSEESKKSMSDWWHVENLEKAEKIIKKRNARSARPSGAGVSSNDEWVKRSSEIFASIDSAGAAILAASSRRAKTAVPVPAPTSTRVLRDRKPKTTFGSTPTSTPTTSPEKSSVTSLVGKDDGLSDLSSPTDSENDLRAEPQLLGGGLGDPVTTPQKKLPKVILKLGPDPNPARNS
ncbi:Arginase/deacetylase [Marasmius fiardii PR-910]|nr:Arginase/deacetylase [Marasmius fiardii PR-910]